MKDVFRHFLKKEDQKQMISQLCFSPQEQKHCQSVAREATQAGFTLPDGLRVAVVQI